MKPVLNWIGETDLRKFSADCAGETLTVTLKMVEDRGRIDYMWYTGTDTNTLYGFLDSAQLAAERATMRKAKAQVQALTRRRGTAKRLEDRKK